MAHFSERAAPLLKEFAMDATAGMVAIVVSAAATPAVGVLAGAGTRALLHQALEPEPAETRQATHTEVEAPHEQQQVGIDQAAAGPAGVQSTLDMFPGM